MSHRQELCEKGFTVFRNLFDKPYIDGLRDSLKERVKEQERQFDTIAMDARPEYFNLYTHPRVQAVLRDELQCPDPKFWGSYFINKNPGETRRPWHHDWYAWDEPTSRCHFGPQLGLMMYLTPTNELNGALETVPGSHVNWWTDDFKVHEDWFRKHPKAEVVVSNPGDLVVTDARTLHATTANSSQETRMMLTMWFFTDWRSMTPEFRAFRAMRDEAYWTPFGNLWPSTDLPFADYKLRSSPRPEDMGGNK